MRVFAGKVLTHLHRNRIWRSVHIRGSEAQQVEAGTDQAILAAVVINQPIAMIATVVFDCQVLAAIQQVWARYVKALVVADGTLNLRPRESGKHQKHP